MGDGFYVLLEKIEPFLPSEGKVEDLAAGFCIMDAHAVHDRIKSNKMVKRYFGTLVQLADGLTREELSEAIVNFLFLHYPSVMEVVASDEKKSKLFIESLGLLLDDLCQSPHQQS